jgi:hypothetical protein
MADKVGHGAWGVNEKSKRRVRFGPLIAQQSQGNEIVAAISKGQRGQGA